MRFNNQDAGLLFTVWIHIVAFLNSSASGRSWLLQKFDIWFNISFIIQWCKNEWACFAHKTNLQKNNFQLHKTVLLQNVFCEH